ncbi:MAG: hypothetical protein JSR44_09450 [Spirochaetes bacterium]|nr:hypothetical protein [Spirochaetota bacterium]
MKPRDTALTLIAIFITGCTSVEIIDKTGYCKVKQIIYATPDARGDGASIMDAKTTGGVLVGALSADANTLQKVLDENQNEINTIIRDELKSRFGVIPARDEILSQKYPDDSTKSRKEKLVKYCADSICDGILTINYVNSKDGLMVNVSLFNKQGLLIAKVPPGLFNSASTTFGNLGALKRVLEKGLEKLVSESCK